MQPANQSRTFGDRLAAVTRRWRIGRAWRLLEPLHRIFPRERVVVDLDEVGRLELNTDNRVQRRLYWTGLNPSDRRIIAFLGRYVPSDGVFIDVGANIGIHTLAMARRLQEGGGTVISFEPHPENFRTLVRNVSLNEMSNVRFENLALSRATETINVRGSERVGNWSLASGGDVMFEIETTQLDNFIQRSGISRIDAIKMDIEGSEVNALSGATTGIDRFQPVIVFEVNSRWLQRMGTSTMALYTILSKHGYAIHRLPSVRERTSVGRRLDRRQFLRLQKSGKVDLIALPRSGS